MSRRFILSLTITVAAMASLAVLGFRTMVLEPPRVAPPPARAIAPASEVRSLTAVAMKVDGFVERSREGGPWVPLARGDRLEENQAIRTGTNSSAELRVDEATVLTTGSETELTIGHRDGRIDVFRLSRGRVAGVVEPSSGRALRIESDAGVVETASARFAVMSSGQLLAVATETGGVTLTAAGQTVSIAAGEYAVTDGLGPPPVRVLPRQLVLKVVRAKQASLEQCAIEGVAEPGAEVRVGGRLLAMGITGHFRVEVPRRPGQTEVLIETRDVAGRSREERVSCGAAETLLPPVSKLRVNWGQAPP